MSPMDHQLAGEKAQARILARASLARDDAGSRSQESNRCCDHLAPLVNRGWVLAFVPLANEPNIRPLLEQLTHDGRLLLPRIVGTTLVPHCPDSLASLETAKLGVQQPGEHTRRVAAADIGVVLVPGIAFGRDGSRLGRGAGFYDRFLGEHRHIRRVGVCFETTFWTTVPNGPLDAPMHQVVTAAGLWLTSSRRQ